MLAAGRSIEIAAHKQKRVAQSLGVEPAAAKSREEVVRRIGRDRKRCIALIDQPEAMNRLASQSSNSGCVGGLPCLPKSFAVGTMPCPK
jgi:hypothetical protein